MNREIKFRAWEKEMKEMILVEDISFELRQINTTSAWRYFEEVELTQYTGLKDENGVEIYEGDIVRVTDDDGSTDFSDGGIGTVGGLEELYMWYIDGEVQNGLFDIKQSYYIEVIGNIYENSELLEREVE